MPGIAVLDKVALNMVVPGMAVLENVIPKSTFSWYTRSRQIYSVCILKLSQHQIIQWNKIMKHEEKKRLPYIDPIYYQRKVEICERKDDRKICQI